MIENLGVTKVRICELKRGRRAEEFLSSLCSIVDCLSFAHRLLPSRPPPLPNYKKKKQNQFDSIDLSDNGVLTLDGFPRLPRLGTLLLSNNRVSRIAPNLENLVPNLSMLVLTNNALRNLADLDALSTLPKLTHLSCLDNVVSKKPMYR